MNLQETSFNNNMLFIHRCGVDGCSKSYFTPNSLTSHMRSHHKEEELRCQWTGCGKKFDKPCRLKAHMRVHTGQRPFACTFEVSLCAFLEFTLHSLSLSDLDINSHVQIGESLGCFTD